MQDISEEHLREYVYPDGAKYTVHQPVEVSPLFMVHGGQSGHIITDARGWVHEISPGWRTLCRIPKRGEPTEDLVNG